MILTVSRMDAEKRANPGYRAFLANGFNVTRALVLFGWEVVLEWTAALRASRRDVRPRGHRGGIYPFLRGGDVRVRARPDRVRRAHRHDARPARGLRDVLELRRGRAPLRASSAPTRSRRCASSTSSSAASSARAATRRARTRSSCSPTTARRRARRSSSATATASTSSSSARSTRGERRRRRRRRRAERDGRPRASARRPAARRDEAAEERRLRPRRRRARLGQPRPRLPDGGARGG